MNRSEFEELELQVQQSGLPLTSYLQQISVSCKDSVKLKLAPISFKQVATEFSLGGQVPQGVALLFPNGLRTHFGNGSKKILMELLTESLESEHV